MNDLDSITARYGFPKPVDLPATDTMPGFKPQVAALIDLDEPVGRVTCCCSLHGSLHNARTCCPVHRQERAGIDLPTMTPLDREADDLAVRDAAAPLTPADIDALNALSAPTYDTSMDPCSPDFDLSTWA